MTNLKTLSVLLGLAAAAVGSAQFRFDLDTSKETSEALFRAMEESRRMNVEAIVMRKSYSGRSSSQCKFEQTNRGIAKYTVLAPICDQGAIMYDNGKVMKNFFPDEKKLMVHDSPRHNSQLAYRQALADQNYRFSTEKSERVAGRAAVVIIAVPRSTGMPSRRYTLDAANSYLLRVETELRGDRKILTDTLAISFPKVLSISDPEREFFSQFRRVEMESPVVVNDVSNIIELVGFRPALPPDLPYGFETLEKQVDVNRNSVAIRISDGLAHATILQSRIDRGDKSKSSSGVNRREARGFEFKLIGDLPDPITSRLLDLFIREVMKGLNPLAETDLQANRLSDLQKNEGDSLLIAVIIRVA